MTYFLLLELCLIGAQPCRVISPCQVINPCDPLRISCEQINEAEPVSSLLIEEDHCFDRPETLTAELSVEESADSVSSIEESSIEEGSPVGGVGSYIGDRNLISTNSTGGFFNTGNRGSFIGGGFVGGFGNNGGGSVNNGNTGCCYNSVPNNPVPLPPTCWMVISSFLVFFFTPNFWQRKDFEC